MIQQIKPYAHQLQSLKHNESTKRVFDCSDCGTGKTLVRIMGFAARRATGGGALLVLAPRSLLRSVWVSDFQKSHPELVCSVADAANREAAFKAVADVYITNHDAAKWLSTRKPEFFKRFSELVVDECFPADTPVDTPTGPRPISEIGVGDLVNTSSGPLPVTRTFTSSTSTLVKIELENGTIIYCTENHPIATDAGWREARHCSGMSAVQITVRQYSLPGTDLLQPELRIDSEAQEHTARGSSSKYQENDSVSEGKASVEQGHTLSGGNKVQNQCCTHHSRAQTACIGRERTPERVRTTGCGDAPINLGASICNTDETAQGQRVPDLLQSRLCQSSSNESTGDRREFARIAQTLGCEERFISGLSRVVSISRNQQRDPINVYNLQIDGPHNYSVQGTLVHNCTAFKHHTSFRSKALAKIAKYFEYRCCMTGTPNGNSITDVWHQVFILDDGQRLGKSFYAFRDSVCSPKQVGPNAMKWTDKEGAEEAVFGLLSDIVIRHKFEDCTDIPPNHTYSVEYDLSSKQLKAYAELEATQMLILQKQEILAINAAAVATKLLQVSSGSVYGGDGKHVTVDTTRYELVLDLVEQRQHSFVLFLWKHQRDALVAEAQKRGVSYAVIDGETSDVDRQRLVEAYQAGRYQVMFGHPKTVAHGVTLTRGTATIWASPTYDLELFAQGSKRQHRIGQTQKTETIVIVAKGTIEEKVWEILEGKNKRMRNLLDLFGTLNKGATCPA